MFCEIYRIIGCFCSVHVHGNRDSEQTWRYNCLLKFVRSVVFLVGVPWLLTEGRRWLIKTAASDSAPLNLQEKETTNFFGVFQNKQTYFCIAIEEKIYLKRPAQSYPSFYLGATLSSSSPNYRGNFFTSLSLFLRSVCSRYIFSLTLQADVRGGAHIPDDSKIMCGPLTILYSLCDWCNPYLCPSSISLLSSLLVQDDPAKSCEDVPGQARHKDQVHSDISAEEPTT